MSAGAVPWGAVNIWAPTVDGVTLKGVPVKLAAEGTFTNAVPTIVGNAADEGALWMSTSFGGGPLMAAWGMTKDDLSTALTMAFDTLAPTLMDAYAEDIAISPYHAAVHIAGDSPQFCSGGMQAMYMARAGIPVYRYVYDNPYGGPGAALGSGLAPPPAGTGVGLFAGLSPHVSDQQSVFANPDISNYGTMLHAAGMTPAALDDAGKKTAATMGAMVKSFAATGVPAVPGSAWGPAGPDGQFTMTFGYDGSATMGLAKRKYACSVWANTYWQGL